MIVLLFTINFSLLTASAQDMTALVNKIKTKLETVNDYEATGVLKTDIVFIKAPISKIKVYFKKPNKFRLKKDGGISVLPKGGVSMTLTQIIDINNFVALAAGDATIDGYAVKVVKVLPSDDNSEVVLATLYIDEANLLVRKAMVTTRENGSYEVGLTYKNYAAYGLPDKVVFSFNTKDYKLPKGITLEFDDDVKPSDADKLKNRKGKVEITYSSYIINKGVDDSVFK